MTFFANSGVRWPRLETETTEAGALSLEMAGRLFTLIGKLEKSKVSLDAEQDEFRDIAKQFRDASNKYREISEQIPDARERQLSRAELDLAAIDDYFEFYRLGYRPVSVSISLNELYQDLALQIRTLAEALENLQLKNQLQDLTSRIFSVMHQWDIISGTARYISVLNQRSVPRR